jgi:hypothetical protein
MDELLDMDIETFLALSDSLRRVKNDERLEQAITAMVAAQGTAKSMKALTKQWESKGHG